jgi:excisionase family DNA binding protein
VIVRHQRESASNKGFRQLAWKDVLTAREAARLLRISRDSLYAGASRGEIPCRRVGRRLLFNRSGLHRWLSNSSDE